MSENNRENIYENPELMFISLFPSRLKTGIVGGGRAALIKGEALASKGCYVEMLAREFSKEVEGLQDRGVRLITGEYYREFISDKHLVIIALNSSTDAEKIREDCESLSKIYIDCRNYKSGMGTVPAQGSVRNISFAVNTKGGNPKAALMLKDIIRNNMEEYDGFIEFINKIRERAKDLPEYKNEILAFIATEDYKSMWQKNLGKEVLLLFFQQEIVEKLTEELI